MFSFFKSKVKKVEVSNEKKSNDIKFSDMKSSLKLTKVFGKDRYENGEYYCYEQYQEDMIRIIEIYNTISDVNNKIDLKEMKELFGRVTFETTSKDLFLTSFAYRMNSDAYFITLVQNAKIIGYMRRWVKSFGYVGIKDLRINNPISIDYLGDLKLLSLNIEFKPDSVLRAEKIKKSNKSTYLKQREMKKERKANSYSRKLKRYSRKEVTI